MAAMKNLMMTKTKLMPRGMVALAGLALSFAHVAWAQDAPKPAQSVASSASPASATSAADTGSKAPEFQQRYPRYKIEAGDQFDVAFDLAPEFNQTVTVQPDGYVTLRGVGDVHVQS
jgi:protein involved in polysaccharide export with SLBB domain